MSEQRYIRANGRTFYQALRKFHDMSRSETRHEAKLTSEQLNDVNLT
jgi:hypothetical protein